MILSYVLSSVAGVFEKSSFGAHAAMLEAVTSLNVRSDVLRDVRLNADVETTPSHDSFNAGKIGEPQTE